MLRKSISVLLVAVSIGVAGELDVGTRVSQYDIVITNSLTDRDIQCIVDLSNRERIDIRLLLAIARQESGFKPNAFNINTDGSKDYGLYQINSRNLSNWRANGMFVRNNVFDPCSATPMSIYVIKACQQKYGNSWQAIECYNKGFRAEKYPNLPYASMVKKHYYDGGGIMARMWNKVLDIAKNIPIVNKLLPDKQVNENELINKGIKTLANGKDKVLIQSPDGSGTILIGVDENSRAYAIKLPKMVIPYTETRIETESNKIEYNPTLNPFVKVITGLLYVVVSVYLLLMVGLNLRQGNLLYSVVELFLWSVLTSAMYVIVR